MCIHILYCEFVEIGMCKFSSSFFRSKSGAEMRIREKVPQLLDIDGDLVHHVHDAAKGLTSTFDTDSKLTAFCRAISTDHD